MGVFARILRRSKATEEAQAAEAQADAGAVAEAGTVKEPKAPEAGDTAVDEGVEIPKQQSAEKAADSEAAEGART